MSNQWKTLKEWPELILDRLDDAGVARITLNRPEKRNSWNRPLCHAFLESLDIVRADKELKIVITRGAGTLYSSGLDLTFLREVSNAPMLDWDRPNLTIQIAEDIRAFPRIMIAQVHGYCLGGALGIMNCHDIVFAAEDAQLGMPVKKLSLIALGGRNISGKEADALGIISQAVPAAELEGRTIAFARDLSTRHLAPLEHHKITVQMGRDLSLSQAIKLDQLVGQRLRRVMDPLGDVEGYLKSQKGGANLNYKRPDV